MCKRAALCGRFSLPPLTSQSTTDQTRKRRQGEKRSNKKTATKGAPIVSNIGTHHRCKNQLHCSQSPTEWAKPQDPLKCREQRASVSECTIPKHTVTPNMVQQRHLPTAQQLQDVCCSDIPQLSCTCSFSEPRPAFPGGGSDLGPQQLAWRS